MKKQILFVLTAFITLQGTLLPNEFPTYQDSRKLRRYFACGGAQKGMQNPLPASRSTDEPQPAQPEPTQAPTAPVVYSNRRRQRRLLLCKPFSSITLRSHSPAPQFPGISTCMYNLSCQYPRMASVLSLISILTFYRLLLA